MKKLFSRLRDCGIDVYLPAKKVGKCTSPYVVINEDRSETDLTGRGLIVYYSISVIAPLTDYNSLEEMTVAVKSALDGTSLRFCKSNTLRAGDDFDGYKRILTYRVLKPMICKKK